MTTIYLLRHGHYDSPTPVAPYRLPGFHLSPQGLNQVKSLADTLSNESIASVFTSPLERTRETANSIGRSRGITPIIDERLIEVRSPLQGKSIEEIHALGGWNWQIYDTPWYKEQKGETLEEICARMVSFIDEKRREYSGTGICAVSHGDPIMLAAAYYGGVSLDVEHLVAMQPYVPMAGGFRLAFEAGQAPGIYPIVAT